MDELLTLKEAAELLKVTERTVRLYCSEDRIPFVKISSRAYRIRKETIEAVINGDIKIGPKK
jgi:excisionase family DNA binding protein